MYCQGFRFWRQTCSIFEEFCKEKNVVMSSDGLYMSLGKKMTLAELFDKIHQYCCIHE